VNESLNGEALVNPVISSGNTVGEKAALLLPIIKKQKTIVY
jgi:hypothetical protein